MYHGLIHRDAVDRIFQQTGKIFDGLTPDIYIAVALGLTVKKACRLNYPITVSGICPRSGSTDAATGKHTGELKDAPHFRGHESYEWDKKSPAIYTVATIWAETCLHALHNFGREDLYETFRVDVLDSVCLWKFPQFADRLYAHAKEYGIGKFTLTVLKYWQFFKSFSRRAIRKVFRKPGDVKRFYGVLDIFEAEKITLKNLK